MSDLRDLLRMKKNELRKLGEMIAQITAQRQAFVSMRDDLRAEIDELQAYIDSKV